MAKSTKSTPVELMTIDPKNIKELSGWEVKQNELVKNHPFVKITDNETYEEAKKNRTALRTGRTDIQKQDTSIGSFFRELRSKTKKIADSLIDITKPHEDKQQAEIDVWEAKKAEEKAEKERIEQERIDAIKKVISDCDQNITEVIDGMTFETIKESRDKCVDFIAIAGKTEFEEFDVLFEDMVERQQKNINETIERLKKAEEQRLQQLKESRVAKINELKLAGMELISKATTDDFDQLGDKIKEAMETDFDFGDLSSTYSSEKFEILKLGKAKSKELKDQKKREDELQLEKEKQSQRENFSDWKESIFDSIRDLTIESTIEETNRIMNDIQSVEKYNPYPHVEDRVAETLPKMKSSLKQKIEEIAESRKLLSEKRHGQLIDFGFIESKEDGELLLTGFGTSFGVKLLPDHSSDDWEKIISEMPERIEDFNNQVPSSEFEKAIDENIAANDDDLQIKENPQLASFSLAGQIDQFLYNYVNEDDFDDAKEMLRGLIGVARENPDELL